jgi:hypothetical protein
MTPMQSDAAGPAVDSAQLPAGLPYSFFSALPRLWTLRLVRTVPQRNATLATVCMGAAWVGLWCGIDWWDSGPDATFFIDATPLFAWYLLAILAVAGLLRAGCKPTPPLAVVLALVMGLVPVPMLLAALGLPLLSPRWLLCGVLLGTAYGTAYLARGLRGFTGRSQRMATFQGMVLLAGFIGLSDFLEVIPDLWAPLELEAPQASTDRSPADEESILFAQAGRIDARLAAISRGSAAAPAAFFLGFAGVGDEKVFAQEIGLAADVMARRYPIDGRSLSLINDERDLENAPLASVSGLRYALRGLASRMDVQRDVLFLAISSHGSQDPAIVVANSDLPLDDLTPDGLEEALEESGIKWRVIIISACYAGGFIDALKNPRSIVLTAAAADRTSFGCGSDSDLTYFGEAFYRDALPGSRSLREAFDKAKGAIAARERREHEEPSKPQAWFGGEMESKLDAMRAR